MRLFKEKLKWRHDLSVDWKISDKSERKSRIEPQTAGYVRSDRRMATPAVVIAGDVPDTENGSLPQIRGRPAGVSAGNPATEGDSKALFNKWTNKGKFSVRGYGL